MTFTTQTGANGVTSLLGTTGNDFDTIVNLPGNVEVAANTGDDTLDLGFGTNGEVYDNYEIVMGGDDDTVNLAGNGVLLNSFVQLDGNNEAVAGDDTFAMADATTALINSEIRGLSGDDTFTLFNLQNSTVNGNANEDTIDVTGAVASQINGGSWADDITVEGDVLQSSINGNKGTDTVVVGAGGRAGDDELTDVSIYGGQGDDTITSNGNADSTGTLLSGDKGNDTITDGEADSTLNGGSGDDVLTAGEGADTLTGGSGADTFNFGNGDSVISDADTNSGFSSITDLSTADTIAFQGFETGDTISNVNFGTGDAGDTLFATLEDGNIFAGGVDVALITISDQDTDFNGSYIAFNTARRGNDFTADDTVIEVNSIVGLTSTNFEALA
ncbi:hypothetical protein OAA10_00960 [bacterium]|nr:hypothetical protein [bacterium]